MISALIFLIVVGLFTFALYVSRPIDLPDPSKRELPATSTKPIDVAVRLNLADDLARDVDRHVIASMHSELRRTAERRHRQATPHPAPATPSYDPFPTHHVNAFMYDTISAAADFSPAESCDSGSSSCDSGSSSCDSGSSSSCDSGSSGGSCE